MEMTQPRGRRCTRFSSIGALHRCQTIEKRSFDGNPVKGSTFPDHGDARLNSVRIVDERGSCMLVTVQLEP
jgi:hypothetical protein